MIVLKVLKETWIEEEEVGFLPSDHLFMIRLAKMSGALAAGQSH
jgi:hypothetical protein